MQRKRRERPSNRGKPLKMMRGFKKQNPRNDPLKNPSKKAEKNNKPKVKRQIGTKYCKQKKGREKPERWNTKKRQIRKAGGNNRTPTTISKKLKKNQK